MRAIIQTTTPNLSKSLDFYNRLGFSCIDKQDQHLVFDSQLCIQIDTARIARPGLRLYKSNWNQELEKLATITQVYKLDRTHVISTPGPLWIYLHIDEEDVPLFKANSECILGSYAGISLECSETRHAAEILSILGFELSAGDIESPWFSMKKEELGVSIMAPNNCPHLFFNPGLTFFNGKKNIEIISKIRNSGVGITEEITVFNHEEEVDNVLLRDPGGLGFFVFSD